MSGFDGPEVPKCLSAAPYETVESGDFKVVHVLPPNPSGNSESNSEPNSGSEQPQTAGKPGDQE